MLERKRRRIIDDAREETFIDCGGGDSGENHAPGEWFDPANAYLGPQRIFLTILGLVGRDGVTEPLLLKRK